MWTILMEAAVNMYNATLVQRSHFAGEQEYLCTPYSVFTVDSANWQAGTTARSGQYNHRPAQPGQHYYFNIIITITITTEYALWPALTTLPDLLL